MVRVLLLRTFGPSEALARAGRELEESGDARHLVISEGVQAGHAQLTGEVRTDAADRVLEYLARGGIAQQDTTLARIDEVAQVTRTGGDASLIWADVIGQANRNARPVARFLVFMIAAGVIAAFGVIEANAILIVGAMAVSPDILPITAICVGVISGRRRLAWRAFATLCAGLGATCLTAFAVTAGLDILDLLPANFSVGESALAGLTTVNAAVIGVAAAAGVAGMLALETRASSAVGVAISITTIPAAAYLGVAAAQGEAAKVGGALAVLAVNVAVIVIAGSLTLIVQRGRMRDRSESRAAFTPNG